MLNHLEITLLYFVAGKVPLEAQQLRPPRHMGGIGSSSNQIIYSVKKTMVVSKSTASTFTNEMYSNIPFYATSPCISEGYIVLFTPLQYVKYKYN